MTIRLYKSFFLSIIIMTLLFVSCNKYTRIAKAPYNSSKVYLCYASSNPEIIALSDMDTSFIKLIDYKIRKSTCIDDYEIVKFEIVPVDYFVSYDEYERDKIIHQALGTEMYSKCSFLRRFNQIYILVHEKDKKTKRIINRNYRKGRNIAVRFSHTYFQNDTLEQMISLKIYNYRKISDFDHMLRYNE